MDTCGRFELRVGDGLELKGRFKLELSGGTRRQREQAAERALSHFRPNLELRIAQGPAMGPGVEHGRAAAEDALEHFRSAIEARAAIELAHLMHYEAGRAGKVVATDDPVLRALQRVVDAGPASIDEFMRGAAARRAG